MPDDTWTPIGSVIDEVLEGLRNPLIAPTDGSTIYVVNGEATSEQVAAALTDPELPASMSLSFSEDGKTTLHRFETAAERRAFVKGLLFALVW